ncbi:hypothetical protein [Streptomyces griseorubiginosus]|uniref:hypothetical protein n=1 Tax=Streptomyces griseorubiginosus TaxID=67304 RepID=UPI003F532401
MAQAPDAGRFAGRALNVVGRAEEPRAAVRADGPAGRARPAAPQMQLAWVPSRAAMPLTSYYSTTRLDF